MSSITATVDNANIWHEAVKWIEGNGGYVHPKLHYNDTQRQVYLGCKGEDEDDGKKTSLSTDVNFKSGLTLLTIPDVCLLTLHTVEGDVTFGKLLFQVVHSLRNGSCCCDDGLYNDEQDVILALYLAYLRQRLDLYNHEQQHNDDDTNHKQETTTSSSTTPSWLFYKPYLDTLPSSSECHLPRQWSMSTIEHYLHGTSLYNRVLKEKSGLLREYELVKTTWLEKYNNSTHNTEDGVKDINNIFPSFEQYDSMMAILTSRGFSNLGYDNVDALIPMLDLLNHVRGAGSTQNHKEEGGDDIMSSTIQTGPDVRYERYNDASRKNAESLPKKRQRMEEEGKRRSGGEGGVHVVTSRLIPMGSTLQMTYGAKGNGALLGRYGFCISNNVEPDGSCNDILELEIKPNESPVPLQIGPKIYSYGPFVKALELCWDDVANNDEASSSKEDDINATIRDRTEQYDEAKDDEENHEMDDDDGGLAAFLDSCDNEMDDDDDDDDDDEESNGFDDYLYNAPVNSTDIVNDAKLSSPKALLSSDIHAVEVLQDILQCVREGLVANALYQTSHNNNTKNNDEIHGSNSNITVGEQYCSILIHSEIQTVDFYMAMAKGLRQRLVYHSESAASQECLAVKQPQTSTIETKSSLSNFVNSVVDAFVSIRHPHIKKDN